MEQEEIINNINSKVNELHEESFYSGRKSKDIKNYIHGLIIGISITFFITSIFEIFTNTFEIQKTSYIINNYNTTLNLTLSDLQIQHTNMAFLLKNYLYFGGLAFLFLIITIYLFMLYFLSNIDSLENKRIIRYKIIKDKFTINELANRFDEYINLEIKKKMKSKLIGIKMNSSENSSKIRVYHKIKMWINEKVNFVIIRKESIIINYSNSIFGANVGKICDNFIKNYEKNNYIQISDTYRR